jgi:hypothetical protein
MNMNMNMHMKLPLLCGVVLIGSCALGDVHARDNGQWGNNPAAIRQWFQNLKRPDNPYMSCCGEADAFEADQFEVEGDHYVAIITDGKGYCQTGYEFQSLTPR